MTGKQADAGKEIQRDLSVKVAHHGLNQLLHEITVDLEEGSCAHAIRFLARLIWQRGFANGVFGELTSGFGACTLRKEGNSLDLRSFGLQGCSELAHFLC